MDSLQLNGQYAFHSIPAFIHGADETEQYYFHPDHLGSSNYITNFVGTVTQHMEYFAFGETFVEEHKNSHNSPYKYNGKELDEETGWYYYGARFYDPRVSLWLSVDPLVEKTMDAYGYCGQNPINLIDPDGRISIDPKFVFSQTQFDSYLNYIIKNMNTPKRKIDGKHRYGYTDSDKHDCVTAVNRSIRTLMNDNTIKAKANMDDQMKELINTNYAEKQITIDFKDARGKKTGGITNPAGYLNKTLSETIKDNLSDKDSGYQFFGMSIMDGYHSVMIVVNNTDTTNPTFNMYDQHGSMFGSNDESNAKSWYSATELDNLLMRVG